MSSPPATASSPTSASAGSAADSVCHTCQSSITTSQFIRVGNFKFHKEHFTCFSCKDILHGKKFHHRDNKFLCGVCFVDQFCHSCRHCNQKIASGSVIQAFGGYYHPEHFCCAVCSKAFVNGKYYESNDKPYCLSEDSQILTSQGWQFLSDFNLSDLKPSASGSHAHTAPVTSFKYPASWPEIAMYDQSSQSLVYDRPSAFILNPSSTQPMIEILQPSYVPVWAPESDLYGRSASALVHGRAAEKQQRVIDEGSSSAVSDYSNHLSLLVTPEHRMLAKVGRAIPDPVYEQHNKKDAPYRVLRAQECLAVDDKSILNVLTAAAGGAAGEDPMTLPFFTDLNIPQKGGIENFLTLYGFFLGAGSLHFDSDQIRFSHVKKRDIANLRNWIPGCGLVEGTDWRQFRHSKNGRVEIRITNPTWVNFFLAEYGPKYSIYRQRHNTQVHVEKRTPVGADAKARGGQYFPKEADETEVGEAAGSNDSHGHNDELADSDEYCSVIVDGKQHRVRVESVNWFCSWVWRLRRNELRCVIRGMCEADGKSDKNAGYFHTSSSEFRDELVDILIRAGYGAYFVIDYLRGEYRPIKNSTKLVKANHDQWVVRYSDSSNSLTSVIYRQRDIRQVQYTGRTWCVTVPSGFIMVRRACTDSYGVVTKASIPVVVGNCEEHWFQLTAEKCDQCGKPVKDSDMVRVQGKLYHNLCLACSHCGQSLAKKGSIFQKDGKVFCKNDYLNFFCKRCTKCGDHILRHCISVNEEFYHPDCLACSVCLKKLEKYICIAGYLRCSDHTESECPPYNCDVCSQSIPEEDVILSVGRKLHPHCFSCSFCSTALTKSGCKLKENKISCENCLMKKSDEAANGSDISKLAISVTPTSATKTLNVPTSPPAHERKFSSTLRAVDEDHQAAFDPESANATPSPVNSPPSIPEHSRSLSVNSDDLKLPSGSHQRRPSSRSGNEKSHNRKSSKQQVNIEWKKGELIGKGSFGKVYMAMNSATGELIAIKQVRLNTNEEQEQAIQIQNEIGLMENLRHPNIVALLGTQRNGNKLNIIMEYVPGKSLDSLLEKFGAFSEKVVRSYTKQLLSALAYAHSNRVVHRDIKGKNILVDTKGNLKLADWGSAKQFANVMSKDAPSLSYNYTPLWTAPEVLVGDYNSKVDIWSLGCVIIEMSSAKTPWSEQNFENPFRALYHIGNTQNIPKIPETLSAVGIKFVQRCLTRNPDNRPSAVELLEDEWLQGIEETVDEEEIHSDNSDESDDDN